MARSSFVISARKGEKTSNFFGKASKDISQADYEIHIIGRDEYTQIMRIKNKLPKGYNQQM